MRRIVHGSGRDRARAVPEVRPRKRTIAILTHPAGWRRARILTTGEALPRAKVNVPAPSLRSAVHRPMAMKCYSLLLGARNTPSHGKRFSRSDDAQIRDITCRHFPDGFTILNADGGWFDPAARKFVKEESRQILICTEKAGALRGWCAELAHGLQQDELLVVEVGAAVSFRVRRPRAVAPRLT